MHPDKSHKLHYRRAAFVLSCSRDRQSRIVTSFISRRPGLPIPATAASLRCARGLAVGCVVLARVPNRAAILSVSLVRCRRDSDRKFLVVLGYCERDYDIEPDASSGDHSARRFVRSAALALHCGQAAIKVFSSFSLVAGCNGSLRHHCRLWQPPSMVSASFRGDNRCTCRCGLRFSWLKNLFACCRNNTVNPGREFVWHSFLSMCATTLRILRRSTSRRWSGARQDYSALCVNRCRRHRRSD